jgi:hypothetical protein
MIDALEVVILGPKTIAGLMTTISSSLSLARAQAAFSVVVFARGPQSCTHVHKDDKQH